MKLKVGDKITVMRLTGSYFGSRLVWSASIWEVIGPLKKFVAELKNGNIIEHQDIFYDDVKVIE